jgi:hypothetical protein
VSQTTNTACIGYPRGYDRIVNRRWSRRLALIGSGALASQAGHLLIYQLQYRSTALSVQSTGAHAYFPTIAKASLGLGAIVVLAALLVIGASQLLTVRPGTKVTSNPSYFSLLATLFTIQITCFVVQETIESLLAGTAVASPVHLILLGSVGQLPIAALAALGLKWLSVEFEAAVIAIQRSVPVEISTDRTRTVVFARTTILPQLALAEACPTAYIKRGPPSILRS